jgi:hypothetical protein
MFDWEGGFLSEEDERMVRRITIGMLLAAGVFFGFGVFLFRVLLISLAGE